MNEKEVERKIESLQLFTLFSYLMFSSLIIYLAVLTGMVVGDLQRRVGQLEVEVQYLKERRK